MPISGLNPISVRPRGGVAKVELIPASQAGAEAAAGFATQKEVVTALAASAAWAFREDRAHYSEERVSKEPLTPLVRHTLEMELPATATGRRSVEELATVSRGRGVVAVVTMASGEALVAGWSERFGGRYPLRLTDVKSISGRSPGDFPTISLTLESVDADPSPTL